MNDPATDATTENGVRTLIGRIHRATLTACTFSLVRRLVVDAELMRLAGFESMQLVDVHNMDREARTTTRIVPAPAGSRKIVLLGRTRVHHRPGDRIVVCAYLHGWPGDQDVIKPRLVVLGPHNSILNRIGTAS